MNAVALAHGFAQAAREHSDPQQAHQAGTALARTTLRRLWEGVGALGNMAWGLPQSQGFAGLPMMVATPWLAPAQINPFDINPLRSLLVREVDFDLLAAQHKGMPKVFVCATNVRTGRGEVFSGPRLSADAVRASA